MVVNALVIAGLIATSLAGMWMIDRMYAGLAGGLLGRNLEARYGVDRQNADLQKVKWSRAGWSKVGDRPTDRLFIARHDKGLLLQAKSAFGHPMSRTILVPWQQIDLQSATDSLGFVQRLAVIDGGGSPADRVELGSVPYSIMQRLQSRE
jgi:hypothetical protein